MAPKPILYQIPLSPPVRAVLLVADAIGLELELRYVDLMKKEQLEPNFVKINPHHTVPTLDDDGLIIWDSHAIATYLISRYASNDSLYPKDYAKRSQIDQRLHFDTGVLFPALRTAATGIFYHGETGVTGEKLTAVESAYSLLEALFVDNKYLVGDELTVADFSCATTVTQLNAVIPIDNAKYPKIHGWLKQLYRLPSFVEINGKNVATFSGVFAGIIEKNKAAAKQ